MDMIKVLFGFLFFYLFLDSFFFKGALWSLLRGGFGTFRSPVKPTVEIVTKSENEVFVLCKSYGSGLEVPQADMEQEMTLDEHVNSNFDNREGHSLQLEDDEEAQEWIPIELEDDQFEYEKRKKEVADTIRLLIQDQEERTYKLTEEESKELDGFNTSFK